MRAKVRRSRVKPPPRQAAERPVARVVVDVSLPHLDRPFDYLVPETMADAAVPGARVRVRFAGQQVNGFILDRVAESEHEGALTPLARVVSPEPVLSPDLARLCRLVADRYAGVLPDVLRLAIPPRHARAEGGGSTASAGARTGRTGFAGTQPARARPPGPVDEAASSERAWGDHVGGAEYLRALSDGRAPRAVWAALPGRDWAAAIAEACAAALDGGRGALVVVPDAKDAARLDAALAARLGGPGAHVVLTAELGPAERYRRWLAVSRGQVRLVVGTRAAAFAPVADLGLVVCWDDGDDLHVEPRAPYPHAREVLTLRAHESGAGALIGGFATTAEGAALLASGWARPLRADRPTVRARAPRIEVAGQDAELARDEAARSARLPSAAWQVAHEALTNGPVLVQVPRRGYLPGLACARCRHQARCPTCAGPFALSTGHAVPACRWCGRPAGQWRCDVCGGQRLRAQVTGAARTAEELGRAFPSVPVRTSGAGGVLAAVGDAPALVVATPGAEPVAAGGYVAALLLDGWVLLGRADLRAAEEALRRWLNAAALVRDGGSGGRVVVLADSAAPAVQALVRWDPIGFAERELAERAQLGFPPAMRVAGLSGTSTAIVELLSIADLPMGAVVLGPVPAGQSAAADRTGTADASNGANGADQARALVRVPRAQGPALATGLRAAAAVRSARKAPDPVRIQIDPHDLD
ncbi:MAG TPA: primosomal protein N' [Actinomycetes bacterium]|nr:primosomal protein N' [Actinomycetes bacterium]